MDLQGRKKLLIVEDEVMTATLEQKMLKARGYQVITAIDGAQAIAEFNDPGNGIDLVLMDIDLGAGMDGTETAATILKDHDIPVVFLSSHTEPEVVDKTEKITSYGYVVKGSGITVLDASIKMAFKLFEAKKELKRELNRMLDRHLDLTTEILGILNETRSFPDAIKCIISAIKQKIGLDAVGIRMKSGNDFPYYAHEGFPNDFLISENSILMRDAIGEPCRNANGELCLECTCGIVLSGLAEASNPLFTEGGSAWTNDSFPFLELPASQDPRIRPRNTCIHKGYSSVALVPIRANNEIVGLLQLNDHKKDRFTLEMIQIFEKICANIGLALMRKQTLESAHDMEARYRGIFESAAAGILVIDPETGVIMDANPRLAEMLGCRRDQLRGIAVGNIEKLCDIFGGKVGFRDLIESCPARLEDRVLKNSNGNDARVEATFNAYEAGGRKYVWCDIRDLAKHETLSSVR